jgi:hypothetical protein
MGEEAVLNASARALESTAVVRNPRARVGPHSWKLGTRVAAQTNAESVCQPLKEAATAGRAAAEQQQGQQQPTTPTRSLQAPDAGSGQGTDSSTSTVPPSQATAYCHPPGKRQGCGEGDLRQSYELTATRTSIVARISRTSDNSNSSKRYPYKHWANHIYQICYTRHPHIKIQDFHWPGQAP